MDLISLWTQLPESAFKEQDFFDICCCSTTSGQHAIFWETLFVGSWWQSLRICWSSLEGYYLENSDLRIVTWRSLWNLWIIVFWANVDNNLKKSWSKLEDLKQILGSVLKATVRDLCWDCADLSRTVKSKPLSVFPTVRLYISKRITQKIRQFQYPNQGQEYYLCYRDSSEKRHITVTQKVYSELWAFLLGIEHCLCSLMSKLHVP